MKQANRRLVWLVAAVVAASLLWSATIGAATSNAAQPVSHGENSTLETTTTPENVTASETPVMGPEYGECRTVNYTGTNETVCP